MRSIRFVFFVVATGLVTVGSSPSFAEPGLPAPLQVEGIRLVSDSPVVVVDFGKAEGRPRPTLERVTLVGTRGFASAHLQEIVKVCHYPCGDELEECHYAGYYTPSAPLAPLGSVVAAIPGAFAIEGFAPTEGHVPSEVAAGVLQDEFTSPIWPDESAEHIRHRIRLEGTDGQYEYAWGSSEPFDYPIRSCQQTLRGPFTRLHCQGLEALIDDGTLLLVSLSDYNEAGADVLASFRFGETEFFVVRLAIKVQTVFGLIYRDVDGWHALFAPRDYALIC